MSDICILFLQEAVHALNTLQSNAAVLETIRITRDAQRHMSLPETVKMANRAGVAVFIIEVDPAFEIAGLMLWLLWCDKDFKEMAGVLNLGTFEEFELMLVGNSETYCSQNIWSLCTWLYLRF